MRSLLSIFGKRSPDIILIEQLAAALALIQALENTIDGVLVDNRTINTAINRIERKQNRWLDVLNLKDKDDDGKRQAVEDSSNAAPNLANTPANQERQAGEPLDM